MSSSEPNSSDKMNTSMHSNQKRSGVVVACYQSKSNTGNNKDVCSQESKQKDCSQLSQEDHSQPELNSQATDESTSSSKRDIGSEQIVTPPNKKTRREDGTYTCRACGNCDEKCHESLFGEFLKQEAITYYEKSEEPENVTENDIVRMFVEVYNDKLCFLCYHNHNHEYDVKDDYQLPMCIESGSLVSTILLIQQQQVYQMLSEKRKYAICRDYMGGH